MEPAPEVLTNPGKKKLDIKEARKAAIRQYREFDKRPPFSYIVRKRADYYQEIDERRVFSMEKKVFNAVPNNQIAPLPDGIGPNHPLSVSLEKLKEWESDFRISIQDVQRLEDDIAEGVETNGKPVEEVEKIVDRIRDALRLPTRKKLMNHHRQEKQKYLEGLRAYQSIYIRSKEANPESKKNAERLYYETLAVNLAHATYTTVRSYVHNKKKGVLRDDQSITMHHLYSCAVHAMNDYREDIQMARANGDWDSEKALYLEMCKEIVIALLHDFFEDLKDIKKSDLKGTLMALTRFDTELSGECCLDHPDLAPRPADYNFIEYYWDEIVTEVEAMSKPEDKNNLEGYLTVNLTTPLRVIRKGRDRGNNLTTLKYMQEKPDRNEKAGQVQARKIKETPEIIEAGLRLLETASPLDKRRLTRSLSFLNHASKEQIVRLNAEYLHEIGEPLSDKYFTEAMTRLAA